MESTPALLSHLNMSHLCFLPWRKGKYKYKALLKDLWAEQVMMTAPVHVPSSSRLESLGNVEEHYVQKQVDRINT